MNRVEIAGILLKEPELEDVGERAVRATLTVIVKHVRYDRRTEADIVETVFVRVQAWEDVAELVTPWQKGAFVHIVGELTQQEVEVSRGKKERKTHVRAMVATLVRTPPRPRIEPGEEPAF